MDRIVDPGGQRQLITTVKSNNTQGSDLAISQTSSSLRTSVISSTDGLPAGDKEILPVDYFSELNHGQEHLLNM